MTEDEFLAQEMIEVTVTCHTDGCMNAGIPITFEVFEDCPVFCGPCGQPMVAVRSA